MDTITRKTTIEQHQGTHPATGMRMVALKDVVTELECDAATAEANALADRLHAARVAIAEMYAGDRQAAEEWIADRADSVTDTESEIALLERAAKDHR